MNTEKLSNLFYTFYTSCWKFNLTLAIVLIINNLIKVELVGWVIISLFKMNWAFNLKNVIIIFFIYKDNFMFRYNSIDASGANVWSGVLYQRWTGAHCSSTMQGSILSTTYSQVCKDTRKVLTLILSGIPR